MRFFAIFYTGIGLVTFALQTALSRISLEKLGLAKTVATLPSALAVGSMAALVFPGLSTAGLARAAESIFRSSLLRTSYELLYTPVSATQQRTAKPLIDVGFERLGDAVGGGTVRLFLLLGVWRQRKWDTRGHGVKRELKGLRGWDPTPSKGCS